MRGELGLTGTSSWLWRTSNLDLILLNRKGKNIFSVQADKTKDQTRLRMKSTVMIKFMIGFVILDKICKKAFFKALVVESTR